MKIGDVFNIYGEKVGEVHSDSVYTRSKFPSFYIVLMILVFLGVSYKMVWQPILGEWNAAKNLSEKIFLLENYAPIIGVPVVSLIKAVIQKGKKDIWANFILSGIILFVVLAFVFSIHQFGVFDIFTGLKYFAKNWSGIYFFIGILSLIGFLMVGVIKMISL